MSDFLSNLLKLKGTNKPSRRVGRGYGSTKGGHVVGKGMKGQKSRTGGKTKQWFEGGQTPLIHKMPYRKGFINHNRLKVVAINLNEINRFVLESKIKLITPKILVEKGIIKKSSFDVVKILSRGRIMDLSTTVVGNVELKGFSYSKKAMEKIKSAGGIAE